MFAHAAPVARNVHGTRTGASLTRRSPFSTTREAWPFLKNVSLLNPCAHSTFFTPSPAASTAHRIWPLSLATVTGLPSFVRRMKEDRKSTRLNSSHGYISYAVFCLKKKKTQRAHH